MTELETKVKLLEKEMHDRKGVFQRLDIAIEKLTDVSNCINRMLAVHEEKITRQEDAIIEAEEFIDARRIEISKQIDDLHSRITTNTKEIMSAATAQHKEHTDDIQKLRNDLTIRVGVLEKWRWLIIGGSIVVGFLLHKFMIVS